MKIVQEKAGMVGIVQLLQIKPFSFGKTFFITTSESVQTFYSKLDGFQCNPLGALYHS